MTTTKYIEYDEDVKRLAEILYDMLRLKRVIGAALEADVLWFDLGKDLQQVVYGIVDDLLEEAADLDYTYEDEDDTEDWEL